MHFVPQLRSQGLAEPNIEYGAWWLNTSYAKNTMSVEEDIDGTILYYSFDLVLNGFYERREYAPSELTDTTLIQVWHRYVTLVDTDPDSAGTGSTSLESLIRGVMGSCNIS